MNLKTKKCEQCRGTGLALDPAKATRQLRARRISNGIKQKDVARLMESFGENGMNQGNFCACEKRINGASFSAMQLREYSLALEYLIKTK
jgi:hypothetical protein